jgi:hypothetical protein
MASDDPTEDPRDDPDFISEDGVGTPQRMGCSLGGTSGVGLPYSCRKAPRPWRRGKGTCIYCLIGEIGLEAYEELVDDATLVDDIFGRARELCLVVVYEAEQAVSNVSSIRDFADVSEMPAEYLPPGPVITFRDVLDVAE